MIKVLFVTKFPPEKDGVGDYSFELVQYLRKYCDVGVLTYKNGHNDENVYRVLDRNKLIFYDVQKYIKFLCKEKGYNVVHFQTASFTFPRNFYLFPLLIKEKLVSTIHEVLTLRQFHYLPFVMNVYMRSNIIITLSKEIAKLLISYYKIKPEKIRVMHHGADIVRFNPNADPKPFRSLFNLEDNFVIMIFGFIGPGKGHDLLIKAFLKISHKMPDAKLVIAGSTKNLNYLEYLKRIASKNKEKIIFTDYIPYEMLPACLASADIFVLPYLGGMHPSGPLHRALATGKAIITSDTPVIKEIIKDGYNGILIKPGNINELANAILRLYEDDELRKKLATNARRFAEQFLDWDKIAKQTVEIYEEVLK
jgi:glycosyltransferase involved in cell wall biosynthesis